MVHEAEGAAEHGVIVDLMEEEALSIQKVLRPADVPCRYASIELRGE